MADTFAIGSRGTLAISRARVDRVATVALMLLPGALVAYAGFSAGGFFPGTQATVAIVVTWILLVRILLAHEPFAGIGRTTAIALAGLGAFALLTLASGARSGAPSRALVAFELAWLYLLVLLLFGSIPASLDRLRWLVRGLALGIAAVCGAALFTRLLPDVWHTAAQVANQRLSYPVTYWNALGLLAALGALCCLHLSGDADEPPLSRVLGAAAMPPLLATLFFTFSRGAIAAGAAGLLVWALLARPRALLSGALAALPAAALLLSAYHANLLDTLDPTTRAAVAQGHHVARVALACVIGAAIVRAALIPLLDPQLPLTARLPRRRVVVGGAVAVVVLIAIPLGAHFAAHEWRGFTSSQGMAGSQDLRQRLTDPSNDGRLPLWHVASAGFRSAPLLGHGAGTFQLAWAAQRTTPNFVVNAHSLYLQTLDELGLLGLAALAVALLAILVGLALRARGAARPLYGLLFALMVMWVLHAGVDWDWEMPTVTIGLLAAAGLGLSPAAGEIPLWRPGQNTILLLAACCLLALVLPALTVASQSNLVRARNALFASNCPAASSAALSSIRWLDVRPEPYEILGLCDLENGRPHLAATAMSEAVAFDPSSWEPRYMLAIAQAAAGIDPRPAAALALRLNPLEPLAQQEQQLLSSTRVPQRWTEQARVLRRALLRENTDLSIAPT